MKTIAFALALVSGTSAAARGSEFLDDLRRAEARAETDPERVEFASRAIRAWTPPDGGELLAEAHFRRAEGELAALDEAAAEEDLAKAVSFDARNAKARLLLARARLRLGRAVEAERAFLECARNRPEDGEAWLGLAEARLARGLPYADKPALTAAAKARALLEDDARSLIAVGRAHLAGGRAKDALESLESAAAQAGDLLPEALAWRAQAKSTLGDPRGARADLGKAAESFEARLAERRRSNAPERAVAAARADAADARFRRAGIEETLGLIDEAREDHRLACDEGLAAACARARALAPQAPAPTPKPRPFKPNPKSGPGSRIYAS